MKISCNSTGPDNLHLCLVIQSCLTLCNLMDCSPPGTSVCGDSAGKNTGVGCHALLQGIYPIQGLNPGLLHCRWILYCLSHQGSPVCTYMSSKLEMPLTRTWNQQIMPILCSWLDKSREGCNGCGVFLEFMCGFLEFINLNLYLKHGGG